MDSPDDGGDELEDCEDDRIVYAPYCGKRLKVFYEDGWHTGVMEYYNESLDKYHVKFEDGSEDYIGEDDIDMLRFAC